MSTRLAGRVILVTGSGRGIGAGLVRRFAREGARVVVNDLPEYEAQTAEVARAIGLDGGEALAYCADVSDQASVQEMVEATLERFGRLDVLINNAALELRGSLMNLSLEDWDRTMAVNLRAPFLCAQAAYPHFKAQGAGKLIHLSSVSFFTGQAGFAPYVTSKGGLIGLTRALARELGPDGITVNCVAPGAVETEREPEKVGVEALERALPGVLASQSLARRLTVPDLQGAFVFLASSESDFITGQTLVVDGGWVMH
jgi:3-oxoacyl-[acyl-carrier protein] reductase